MPPQKPYLFPLPTLEVVTRTILQPEGHGLVQVKSYLPYDHFQPILRKNRPIHGERRSWDQSTRALLGSSLYSPTFLYQVTLSSSFQCPRDLERKAFLYIFSTSFPFILLPSSSWIFFSSPTFVRTRPVLVVSNCAIRSAVVASRAATTFCFVIDEQANQEHWDHLTCKLSESPHTFVLIEEGED